MKKTLSVLLVVAMLLMIATGCANQVETQVPESTPSETEKPVPEAEVPTEEPEAEKGKGMRIALVTDPIGNQPFLKEMVRGVKEGAAKYGAEAIIVECADNAAFEDNMRALLVEGVDLLIGGGWKAGEAINKLSLEEPDATSYCLLDSVVESENVKCISFREQEGAYLLGQMMALAAEENENLFGQVAVFQGPGAWKWTWGFREGVKSIKQDPKFIVNFAESYEDPVKAKEFALQQYAQGAKYIYGLAAGGNFGIFEAALEKSFYTSCTDTDQTTSDNPYIMGSIIKDTYATAMYVIDGFFSGEPWKGGNEVIGIKEGAIGLTHVTHEAVGPLHPNLTDDDMAMLKETAEAIKNGTYSIDFTQVPPEDWFPAQ